MDTAGITDTGGSIAAEGQAGIFALRAKAAEKLCDSLLAGPLRQCDINEVERQLGRYPRGMVAVGARCVCGRPLVTVTRPLLDGKYLFQQRFISPFPQQQRQFPGLKRRGKWLNSLPSFRGRGALAAPAVLAGLMTMANLMVPYVPAAPAIQEIPETQVPG